MGKFSTIGWNIGMLVALQLVLVVVFAFDPMARLMQHFTMTQSFIIGIEAILILFGACGATGALLPALVRRKL